MSSKTCELLPFETFESWGCTNGQDKAHCKKLRTAYLADFSETSAWLFTAFAKTNIHWIYIYIYIYIWDYMYIFDYILIWNYNMKLYIKCDVFPAVLNLRRMLSAFNSGSWQAFSRRHMSHRHGFRVLFHGHPNEYALTHQPWLTHFVTLSVEKPEEQRREVRRNCDSCLSFTLSLNNQIWFWRVRFCLYRSFRTNELDSKKVARHFCRKWNHVITPNKRPPKKCWI